eukprot:CAMPEP_0176367010 /NCGR_PEP_ID=MMETSP0126-20121128/21580_1 /TAXON_ID=141414 ORGANISM="Strombidinopsis acuminatum, Strain SPMC142" /NCGR_SAMPLE_ID=MMETSP0126 /ASSEMBLY_ACC=CAM_ASM_000229 /LENGTH=65 /DNA_ID=CAMNT_0017724659 /DNA_START=288 /DNA_END=485 /DNA_ORIENTATION=+
MSLTKPIFDEAWDPYQMKIAEIGGNKRLYDFLAEYKKEKEPQIWEKYATDAAKWYRNKLSAEARG